MHPRSRCPRCGHSIPWYENVPVVSWLALKGRCAACRAPISWRYPLVELLTGVLFVACLARFDWTWSLLSALILVSLLLALTFIDLEHWLLPFAITIPGIVAGLVLSAPQGVGRVRDSAVGAVGGFLFFWFLEWAGAKVFRKEALGGGDKFLLALLGAFLTFRPLIGVVFLASVQGALVGTALLLVRGRAGPAPPVAPKEEEAEDEWVPGPTNLPFGPWLALAGMEVLLLGPHFAALVPFRLGWFMFGGGWVQP